MKDTGGWLKDEACSIVGGVIIFGGIELDPNAIDGPRDNASAFVVVQLLSSSASCVVVTC